MRIIKAFFFALLALALCFLLVWGIAEHPLWLISFITIIALTLVFNRMLRDGWDS